MKEKIYSDKDIKNRIKTVLENEGVDNWHGYEEACSVFNEMNEGGEIEDILDDFIFEEVEHEDLDPSVELNVIEL